MSANPLPSQPTPDSASPDKFAPQSHLVALMFTDIIDSTGMKSRISTTAYTASLQRHNALFEQAVAGCRDAKIIKHTGDGFFARFHTASDAARCALRFQRDLASESWPSEAIRTRIGIHMGEIAMVRMLDRTDIVGSPADVAARVMSLGTGGQILFSRLAADEARRFVAGESVRWTRYGQHRLKGVGDPLEVWELADSATAAPVRPADATDESDTPSRDLPERIGPYRILESLGSGGMGEVYKAERRSPMRQIVAIKIIKLGYDTREVIARFESEREALARMDHPHIARVLDAGSTDAGRPYFVMEYVAGVPITDFADDKKLTIKERLNLFTQVCDAINHAHTKAIIHRDIKASNVLACLHDGKPTVKVIDFGIAKALTGDRLTDRTFNTGRGEALGTYESMSPEQADGSPDIDTRTDVYSLGVLLYELLSGAKPFETSTLAAAADQEIRRIIREIDPPKLSTRLSSLGSGADKVAALRRDQLDHLTSELGGELEWIPLKCMRKERDRRYASAQALGEDIQNYLHDRSLIAAPESRVYRARKLLRRNRGAAAAICAIVLVLTLGAAATIQQMKRAQRFEADYKALLTSNVNEPIAVATPLSDKLEEYGKLSEGEAELKTAADDVLRNRKPATRESLTLMSNYSRLLREQGRIDDAESLNRDVLKLRRRVLGDQDEDTSVSVNNLGVLLLAQQRTKEAEPLLLEVLDRRKNLYGIDDERTLTAMNNVAALKHMQGKLAEAEALFKETFERRRRVLVPTARETLLSMNSYGALLRDRGAFHDAEPLLKEALNQRRKLFGPDDPDTLQSMHDVGALLRDQRKFTEAEPLFRHVFETRRRVLTADHPDVLGSQNLLALVLRQSANYRDAERLSRELYDRAPSAQLSPQAIAAYRSGYGVCLAHLGRYADAEPLLQEAYDRLNAAGLQKKYVMREVVEAMAIVFEHTNRPIEAANRRTEFETLKAVAPPTSLPTTTSVTRN